MVDTHSSFGSLLQYEAGEEAADAAEESGDAFHPETGELILGDIMIAVPRMLEQAKQFGHGSVREFAFLVAHSMLHLMGYDHMSEEEAAVMETKQEAILEGLGIRR